MRYRTTTLAVAGGLLLAAAGAVLLPTSAQAAAGCQVTYATNDWTSGPGQGGFTANVTIKNLGDPLSSWTLGFTFPGGQQLQQGWSATWSQSGANVTAANMSYNGSLGTNASTTIGFNGTWTGSNPKPAVFTLNGVTCNGTTTSPSPSTSPSGSPSVSTSPSTSQPPPSGAAPKLKVSGNKLVTSTGSTYRLLGVNRSGGEFACIQGNGIWDGPMDQASVNAMRTWKIRTVRVPLNEECWLGTSDVQAAYGGANYQNAVKTYVNLLVSSGITPIVEMHWNYGQYTGPSAGCSDVKATCQKPMPDAQYAPSFWTGVANAFKGNDAVIFDLFNEPYPERATGSASTGWACWRDGGTCNGISYQVAGFQSLVNAVRATGATNVIMIGGLAYSNDLTQWLQYKPTDPQNNIAAFAHLYNFNTCSNTSCFDSQLAPVAAQVPLSLTEIGENDCAHGFVDTVMNWADAHGVGYLGWTWNTWDCSSGPSLISNYNGTATAFGQGIKDHLAAVSS
ncbi:MAG TPA: cellulase family glycosylhydrolase [Dactylosporangium sp.]|nr:cellulase family glycosylhydrolase [Dactylosporangium sp.]